MTDPYLPALAAFALTEDEATAIAAALEADSPWEWKPNDRGAAAAIGDLKTRILAFHLQRHGGTCCYCRTILHGAGPFMTDREHILPKGKAPFKPYSYTMWNLAAACKRCNMQFKRSGDAFVIDPNDATTFQSSANYRFVHPNFDRWEDHLTRYAVQANHKLMVLYVRADGSSKAHYTYEFFGLKDLQIDSFDEVQGIDARGQESDIGSRVRELANRFGQ